MIDVKSMTLQFIDSRPDGIKICHVEGESLVTIVVPREMLAEAKQLPEIPKRGVYYLLDEDHGVINRVYAGQTTQGLRRLESHKSSKDFWNIAIMFLDNESNIDRDVLDALEADAIKYVRTHGSYETDNSDTPQPYVSPYKERTVMRLHRNILFRMAALGYDLDHKDVVPTDNDILFHTHKRGVVATGCYEERTGSFTVFSGSQVDLTHPIQKNFDATARRNNLFGDAGGIAILKEEQTFSTPSMAAVFVLGGSQNGWTEWINESGRTLDQVYRGKKD